VDNASADDSAEMVRQRFPDCTLIANPRNVGFGAACNQALPHAGEFLLVLNPDATLEPGALETLLSRASAREDIAVVGPRLRYLDDAPQPSRRRFPTPATLLCESTPLDWRLPNLPWLRRYRYAGERGDRAHPVDWVSGACLLIRASAFRQVGGFDPAFFMYFEEVDLCRRLRALGWRTWYEPGATVTHHHSRSADLDLTAKDRNYYRSKHRYAARYFGRTWAALIGCGGAPLFAAEALAQLSRGQRASAARYASLARWHLLDGR
jgi:GT2 family glycosyltransferase